jgi:hypothetical protein
VVSQQQTSWRLIPLTVTNVTRLSRGIEADGTNMKVENPEVRFNSGGPAGKEQDSRRNSSRGRRAKNLKSKTRNGTQRRFLRVIKKKYESTRANKRQGATVA